nr:MAG TPA: hypothetical protein [Bacteriophage sp.]
MKERHRDRGTKRVKNILLDTLLQDKLIKQ